jgi:hypothetical protein
MIVNIIIFVIYYKLDNANFGIDDIKNMLIAIISLNSAGAIAIITLFFQDKSQSIRDEFLIEMGNIIREEYEKNNTLILGPLIQAIEHLHVLKKILEKNLEELPKFGMFSQEKEKITNYEK